jgi:hypothetical protein
LIGAAPTSPKPTLPATRPSLNGTSPVNATATTPAVFTKTQGSAAVRGVEVSFGVVFAAAVMVVVALMGM